MIKYNRLLPNLVLFAVMTVTPAYAQTFARCNNAGVGDLDASIRAHEAHMRLLNMKFMGVYYDRTRATFDGSEATRGHIMSYLQELGGNTGVLFYAERGQRLCVWLITPDTVGQVSLDGASIAVLNTELRASLEVGALEQARAPTRKTTRSMDPAIFGRMGFVPDRAKTLAAAAHRLLPPAITEALRKGSIRNVILVPTSSLGTFPLTALPYDEGRLADKIALTIAPGFFIFKEPPPPVFLRRRFADSGNALVVGDPEGHVDRTWSFPRLPHARAEALAVARLVAVTPLIGRDATVAAVMQQLANTAPSLIYFATHGIGDATNPLDASFLLLANGRLPAVRIKDLNLDNAPLVVLSACQTGLGKNFEMGTIGMTRAWQRAGARAVVMSLWSVDDAATGFLMQRFIEENERHAPHEALRLAMVATAAQPQWRNEKYWAGFAVFGVSR